MQSNRYCMWRMRKKSNYIESTKQALEKKVACKECQQQKEEEWCDIFD